MRFSSARRYGRNLGLCVLALGAIAAFLFFVHPVWVGEQSVRLILWKQGVASKSVTIDGNNIHYFEVQPKGTPQLVPVVLVHGLGGRSEDWAAFLPALAAQGYHVYAPDLLGYGRSAQPKDASYSIPQEEDVVTKFMASRGITQTDVVGWSMGGWITMRLAMDHPQRVRRVVLIDAAGIYFHPGIPLSSFAPQSRAELDVLFHSLEAGDHALPYFVARDALVRLKKNGWVVTRSIDAMMSGQDLLDFKLGDLQQPVLIEWGAADRLIPKETGERLHLLIPQSQYVEIPGCGHLMPIECSAKSLQPVESFLAVQ